MEDYKKEIENTRFGCVGSSDAAMLARIAHVGGVPKGALRRLAVVKGLAENRPIPYTDAVRTGDEVEMAIYEMLHAVDERFQSNPCWTSITYSRPNVTAIDHPDIVLEDGEKKVLRVYEVKASKFPLYSVRAEYMAQLYYHRLFAEEIVRRYGRPWRAEVYLVHYDTSGLDLSQPFSLDAKRLTVRTMRMGKTVFDLPQAMNIVNAFLATFDEYYDGDEIESHYLPAPVRDEFEAMTQALAEIKERETRLADFKARLYSFMEEHGIKSIKNDAWSIVRVDESTSHTFDSKRFLEDYSREHPQKAKKLVATYSNTITRKGNVQIRLKKN